MTKLLFWSFKSQADPASLRVPDGSADLRSRSQRRVPTTATKVVDQLTKVAPEKVESRLRLLAILRSSSSSDFLFGQAQLNGPAARHYPVTLGRGDGEAASPRPVHDVGNDIVTPWAGELFAHPPEHSVLTTTADLRYDYASSFLGASSLRG